MGCGTFELLGFGDAGADSGPASGDAGASAAYSRGGLVRDVEQDEHEKDDEEHVTVHEGEFIVNVKSTKKYRKILEAINADVR